MLCEQCQSNEATVHFSALAWPSGEVARHLCETCFPGDEAERTRWYGLKPEPQPFIQTQHFAAEQYLEASATASALSADVPAYRRLLAEAFRFPAKREQAAIEILTRALQTLEKGKDAWDVIGFGSSLGNSAPGPRSSAFVELLEKIFLRSVELMAQSQSPPADHPFGLGLTMASKALRRADLAHFLTMLECLKAEYKGDHPAHPVLDYLERHESEKWGSR